MTDVTTATSEAPTLSRPGPATLRVGHVLRGSVAAAILAFLIIPDSEIAAKSFKANLIARNLSMWAASSLSD